MEELKKKFKWFPGRAVLMLLVGVGILAAVYVGVKNSRDDILHLNDQESTVELSPQPFENIEHIKILLQRLLSFESAGGGLPPELLNNFFTEKFQEKYISLAQKTFSTSDGSQTSEVKKLSQVSDNQWQAWIEIQQKNKPSTLLSFRLTFDGNLIDQLTLEQNVGTDIPVLRGSPVFIVRIVCAWNDLKLRRSPQWLKQLGENEYLVGFEKSRLLDSTLEIPCGAKVLKSKLNEGAAFLDESMMDQKIIPKKINSGLSDVEKRLQESLGFTVE